MPRYVDLAKEVVPRISAATSLLMSMIDDGLLFCDEMLMEMKSV